MKNIRIFAIGRLKTSYWREAAAHYQKCLAPRLCLQECTFKDADPGLPLPERKRHESRRMLKQLRPKDTLICLDETGMLQNSHQFAHFLHALHASGKTPCFMLGGAYGLAPEALSRSDHILSFGLMTFPHELARIFLLEQIYRAENILAGTGYHH